MRMARAATEVTTPWQTRSRSQNISLVPSHSRGKNFGLGRDTPSQSYCAAMTTRLPRLVLPFPAFCPALHCNALAISAAQHRNSGSTSRTVIYGRARARRIFGACSVRTNIPRSCHSDCSTRAGVVTRWSLVRLSKVWRGMLDILGSAHPASGTDRFAASSERTGKR
jgi:hypothetical protein